MCVNLFNISFPHENVSVLNIYLHHTYAQTLTLRGGCPLMCLFLFLFFKQGLIVRI